MQLRVAKYVGQRDDRLIDHLAAALAEKDRQLAAALAEKDRLAKTLTEKDRLVILRLSQVLPAEHLAAALQSLYAPQ
jgi:hypothetical protein